MSRTRLWQDALNDSWPPNPAELRDRPEPRPVTIRVVWAVDGVEHIDAVATRWTDDFAHVYCQWDDPRLRITGMWLALDDVKARG